MNDNIKNIENNSLSVVDKANSIEIKNNEGYEFAAEFLKTNIKAIEKQINDAFDPIIKKAHESHKEAIGQKKKFTDHLDAARACITNKMRSYRAELERKRIEEENRLREIARKEAEERKLKEAIEAEEDGAIEEAEEILSEKISIAPVIVKTQVPKVDGIKARKVWKFRIIDPSKIPDKYKMIDERAIGGVVRALKEHANIPGVEVYSEETIF